MTSIEEHKKAAKELTADINEKIRANLVIERQKIIGFAASEASANLFAILLHKNNLITPGFNVNHKFFVSLKKAEETFNFHFEKKDEIIRLMVNQEGFRNSLCYGKEKEPKIIENCITNYFKLKLLIEELTGEVI